MKFRWKLFANKNPYDLNETKELFFAAIKENCTYQYLHCSEYKAILDSLDFNPESLRTYDDVQKIPFLPTIIFKKHKLFSMPEQKFLISATSSGTKGKKSRIGFELSGLICGLRMVLRIGKVHKLFSFCPANYIMLGYKPHKGNQTAVTKTAFGSTFFAPALSRTYALKFVDDGYQPDLEGVISRIIKHSHSRFPLRFMGFPSYTYFVLKMMDDRGITLNLKKGSKLMLGGGWKQFYTEQVDKEILYKLADKVLGIKECDIVEFYGAVEHPILYCDCKEHHFHIPIYSRVIIRDVNTLEPLENGKVGLVNLITPMVLGTPILSVMTDDLGILHPENTCKCGISAPYLEIIGRVGMKDIKTCAAGAAELLSNMNV